jgi:hypothetical protein
MNDFEDWYLNFVEEKGVDLTKEEAKMLWNSLLDRVMDKREELSYMFGFSGEKYRPSTYEVIQDLKKDD